ncbi:MAG TPA: SGNH/GDSL hydrolase family protein [Actinospica sp.]|nr:SGNH/GDSL hydrolase family protein [Actinospica sp.]
MKSVRTRRCVSAIATAGTAAALTLFATGAAHAASYSDYVALGDSYSSGVGSGSYINSCDVSESAYPYLYDKADSSISFTDEACSGAKTSDVISSQLGALNSSTDLVSITIGGNDAGFSTVMEDCVLEGTSGCVAAVNSAESYAKNTLPGLLDTTYADIRKDAPNAHVIVIGYPEFYDLSQSGSCVGLSGTSRTAINGAADVLDSVIATQVAKYGDFVYEDVRSNFSGHEICDSSPWLHSLNWLDITESYHPTADGQQYAYYPAFEAGL